MAFDGAEITKIESGFGPPVHTPGVGALYVDLAAPAVYATDENGVFRIIGPDSVAGFDSVTINQEDITNAATTDLDMAASATQRLSLTQNTTFTTSNLKEGGEIKILMTADGGGPYTLAFPAGWTWVGAVPTQLAASKSAVLSLTSVGTSDSDVWAAYKAEE